MSNAPLLKDADVEALEAGTLHHGDTRKSFPQPQAPAPRKAEAQRHKDILDRLIEQKDNEELWGYWDKEKKNIHDAQVLELLIERLRYHASRMGSGIPEWEIIAQMGFLVSELREFEAQLDSEFALLKYFVEKVEAIPEFGTCPSGRQVDAFLAGVADALSPHSFRQGCRSKIDIALKETELYMNLVELDVPAGELEVVVDAGPGAPPGGGAPQSGESSFEGSTEPPSSGAQSGEPDAGAEQGQPGAGAGAGITTAASEVLRVKRAVLGQSVLASVIQHDPPRGHWEFGEYLGEEGKVVDWHGGNHWQKNYTEFLQAFRHTGDAIVLQHSSSSGGWNFGSYKQGVVKWYPINRWGKNYTTHLVTFTHEGQGIVLQHHNGLGNWQFGKYDGQGSVDWYSINRWEKNTTSHIVAFGHESDTVIVKHNTSSGRWWFGVYGGAGNVNWCKGCQQWAKDCTTHLVGFVYQGRGVLLQHDAGSGAAFFGDYDGAGGVSWHGQQTWDKGTTSLVAFDFDGGVIICQTVNEEGLWRFGKYDGKGGVEWQHRCKWAKNYTKMLCAIPAFSMKPQQLADRMLRQMKAELKEDSIPTYVGASQGDPLEVLAGRLAFAKNKGDILSLQVFVDRWWERLHDNLSAADAAKLTRQAQIVQEFASVRLSTSLAGFVARFPVCAWYTTMLLDNLSKGHFGLLTLDSHYYTVKTAGGAGVGEGEAERPLPFTVFGKAARLLENMQAIGPRSLHSTVPDFSEAATKIHLVVLPEFILDATRLRASICAQAEQIKTLRAKVLAGMATGTIAGAQFLVKFSSHAST